MKTTFKVINNKIVNDINKGQFQFTNDDSSYNMQYYVHWSLLNGHSKTVAKSTWSK